MYGNEGVAAPPRGWMRSSAAGDVVSRYISFSNSSRTLGTLSPMMIWTDLPFFMQPLVPTALKSLSSATRV